MFTKPSPGSFPVQFKLQVGSVNDPLEAEADQVAEQVMRMPDPAQLGGGDAGDGIMTDGSAEPTVRRMCAGCSEEEEVHRKPEPGAGPKGGSLGPDVSSQLGRLATRPMSGQLREFFEPRFGRSFAGVRLTTGPETESAAEHMGARAFSFGNTIGFGQGEFAPNTTSGRKLLAHELTHVVQQSKPEPVE